MKIYSIENETNNITLHNTAKEAAAVADAETFRNEAGLDTLAAKWPATRLIEIWNSLPGVTPVRKFKDRGTAVNRIWKAIQSLGAAASVKCHPTAGSGSAGSSDTGGRRGRAGDSSRPGAERRTACARRATGARRRAGRRCLGRPQRTRAPPVPSIRALSSWMRSTLPALTPRISSVATNGALDPASRKSPRFSTNRRRRQADNAAEARRASTQSHRETV
jgi:hypothetical protein